MRLSKDPRYKFYNLEAKLNQSGNDLIGRNQMQNALYVFDLNTKLYPQSAKAWLGLAEGLEKAKQVEKATAAYQKVVELGGNSALGEQARLKLKGLNRGK